MSRRMQAWRVVGGLALAIFGAWTAWTVVDILAEGAPPRPASRGGGATDEVVKVAVAADIGSDAPGRATLDKMVESDPDVYVALGDLSYAGPGSEEEWCGLVRSKVGPVAPFEIVAGNHEEDAGEDGRIANFAACLPDRLNSVGEYGRQYYFDVGELARFIMISPDLTIDGVHYSYGEANANIAWVEDAIDDARADGIRWVVVGMHKNCISVGEYYCDVHQDLFSLLIEKRVDLVVSGHDHTYQRSKQLAAPSDRCPQVVVDSFDADCVVDDGDDGDDDEYRLGAGTVFVIAGAGGGELYDVDLEDPEAEYFASVMGANRNPRHGFARLAIDPSSLSVRFVGHGPGSFVDEFSLLAAPREGAPDG